MRKLKARVRKSASKSRRLLKTSLNNPGVRQLAFVLAKPTIRATGLRSMPRRRHPFSVGRQRTEGKKLC
jgi:hypothetical protein